jgi:methylenetetrahydrofolate reductase (NADPH)
VTEPTGRLARLLAAGEFVVTGEIVPPRGASAAPIVEHAKGLAGYVDAVNLTDNPTASAHMSPLAGVRFAHEMGVEPTLQITARDRNSLALTADLLGAWALGARNVFCLTGDPVNVGDAPTAQTVGELSVAGLIGLAKRLRDEGTTLAGKEIDDPPRFLIGASETPLAEPYDPTVLEAKLDAGADFIMTQIVYDVDALASWAERMRARGLFERAAVIVGISPLNSAKQARFIDERLPGVSVSEEIVSALEAAGPDAPEIGLQQATGSISRVREIDGVAGVHIMAMGHDEATRALVERAGLFPRPTLS